MKDHDHVHPQKTEHPRKVLSIALVLTSSFILVEIIGGIITGSLALITDAFHMLTDALSIGLALAIAYVANRPHDTRHTFGRHRFEILASLANGLFLVVIVIWTVVEAYNRLFEPLEIDFIGMFVIGIIGLLINVIVAAVLFSGQKDNLNVRGAFLHVLGDALGSVGVIAAAILINYTKSNLWDLIVSVAIALLIALSSYKIIRESIHILAEGTPRNLDIEALKAELKSRFPIIANVHDFHAWTITSNLNAASFHILLKNGNGSSQKMTTSADQNELLQEIQQFLKEEFDLQHLTIQFETEESRLECKDITGCHCEH